MNTVYALIFNPNAGGGRGALDKAEIIGLLRAKDIHYKLFETHYRHHAMELTRQAVVEGYRHFIVGGGDGTINEVVNGIMRSSAPVADFSLAVLMVGTGNDWGRMFNIPNNYRDAVALIVAGKRFYQDVGKVRYFLGKKQHCRYFINTAGLGFDALVVKNTNISKDKGRSGKFSYLLTMFRTLLKYRKLEAQVQLKERALKGSTLFTMSIGIGKYSGGGMQQVPEALPDDGLFDIMLIHGINKWKIIMKIKKLYNGQIGSIKEVTSLKTEALKVIGDHRLLLEADGETLGHGPFEFEIDERKLPVIVS